MGNEGEDIEFTLNHEYTRVRAPRACSALELLRDRLGIASLKAGCAPQGACGACTAIIDGRARITCTMPAHRLHGTQVLTMEGIEPMAREVFARAFAQGAGLQCGFCTPGIVLRTKALLDQDPSPSREQVARNLRGHICRCTGWTGIFRSVDMAAAMLRRDEPSASRELERANIDAQALVLGQRPFVADLGLLRGDLLHASLVWTPLPRCRIVEIDTSAAQALPGVERIITAADLPGARKTGLVVEDWPVMVGLGEETRCAADVVAAIAARDRRIARQAASLVRVRVQELKPLLDLETAAEQPENILSTTVIRHGDAHAAIASAPLVLEETFHTQRVDQAFLEPEASLATPVDGGIHVMSNGQGIFDDRRSLCRVLNLPPEKVRVELVPPGGAFGGREDLSVQHHASLLALATGKPVMLVLDMSESLRFHPKRHPMILRYSVAADSNGLLLAVRARILGDTGGYASVGDAVMARAAVHACGPYAVNNVDVETRAVYTNNPVSGAMRGFGVNQVAFAMESCMNRLAWRLGMDPLEIRLLNALKPGQRSAAGQHMDEGLAMRETLEALRPHYESARARGLAVGLACGMKSVGMGSAVPERGRASIQVLSPRKLLIHTPFTEMGQGHFSAMALLAAGVTGLPLEMFKVVADTGHDLDCGMTTASRGTFLGGRAVMGAAYRLKQALSRRGGKLSALAGRIFTHEYRAPTTVSPDTEKEQTPADDQHRIHFAYSFAAQLAILDHQGRLEKVIAAQDVGVAINPLLCRAQVEGAVHMGVGYALSEELLLRGGVPDTRYRSLGVLGAHKSPQVKVILVESPHPEGPMGAKGIGEIGLVPTAPAIAAALHGFDGRWRHRLPMRDSAAARHASGKSPGSSHHT